MGNVALERSEAEEIDRELCAMIDEKILPIHLERRRVLREMMVKIHPTSVCLNEFMCGSIGCIAGWLSTTNEYQQWYQQMFGDVKSKWWNPNRLDSIETYLGVFREEASEYSPFSVRKWDERKGELREKTDQEIAVLRCDKMIAYAEEQLGVACASK